MANPCWLAVTDRPIRGDAATSQAGRSSLSQSHQWDSFTRKVYRPRISALRWLVLINPTLILRPVTTTFNYDHRNALSELSWKYEHAVTTPANSSKRLIRKIYYTRTCRPTVWSSIFPVSSFIYFLRLHSYFTVIVTSYQSNNNK